MEIPRWIKEINTPYIKTKHIIPIYAPSITDIERTYILQCLDTKWISSKGPFVEKFEFAFSHYCNVPYAVSCSSGTAALFLALKMLNIKPHDEVIIPTFTMISTAFAVSYCGATPVFVDCELKTGNILVDQIERYITKKTKAIILVHIYGCPCSMDRIRDIAKHHGLFVVEDAAEAFGSEYSDRKVGSFGEAACFSLYVNKVITSGEGGMITVGSKKAYDTLRKLNNYYFSQKRHFWHQKIGYNFRMSNVQAAIGLAQLERAEELLQKKRVVASWYREMLSDLREKFVSLQVPKECKSNNWHTAYRVNRPFSKRMKLRHYLARHGVETRGFFIPLHLQPAYRKRKYIGLYPNSEELAQSGILLPSGPDLTRDQIEYISSAIHKFFQNTRSNG